MASKTKTKTGVNQIDVEHVAKLARLHLSKSEIKKFQKDIEEILIAFKDLDRVKTKDEPSFQPIDVRDVFREDTEEQPLGQEKTLANTKHKENGYFKGPRAV